MENYPQILAAATEEVTALFARLSPGFTFHNLDHTLQVTRAAGQIMAGMPINSVERDRVLLACLFHDTGFSAGRLEGHETISIEIATGFLQRHNADAETIAAITACIAATRMPQRPLSLLDQVICDADLAHLGGPLFPEMTGRLKTEIQWYFKKPYDQRQWDELNIAFMAAHRYFTPYGQQQLEPVKQEWLQQLIRNNR